MPEANYIGLMSGTSMDAIDAACVNFADNRTNLLSTFSLPLTQEVKQKILRCCQETISIHDLGEIDRELGLLFANAAQSVMEKANLFPEQISAIGSHGQTIFHHPFGNSPFTLQIADPNIIAAKTDIITVADFRRKDMALGGQAAPLTPAFHNYLFRDDQDCFVINIGGIANITYLPAKPSTNVIGFDTGPGNTLLDQWCFQQIGKAFDDLGRFAKSGRVNKDLLNLCLADEYFAKNFPKSTGREYFNMNWLKRRLSKVNLFTKPEDVQATLVDLTAKSIADAIIKINPKNCTLWVCGGGAKNQFLMTRLQHFCAEHRLKSTAEFGMHPDWIEASAFAWLAKQTLEKKPGNIASVTGAAKASILGGIYYP